MTDAPADTRLSLERMERLSAGLITVRSCMLELQAAIERSLRTFGDLTKQPPGQQPDGTPTPLTSPAWAPGDGYARCTTRLGRERWQCVFRDGHPPHGCTGDSSNPGTPDVPCPQHPAAPVMGGVCGRCTVHPEHATPWTPNFVLSADAAGALQELSLTVPAAKLSTLSAAPPVDEGPCEHARDVAEYQDIIVRIADVVATAERHREGSPWAPLRCPECGTDHIDDVARILEDSAQSMPKGN